MHQERCGGTFLVVQWLRLCASSGGGMGSTPRWGSYASRVASSKKKKKVRVDAGVSRGTGRGWRSEVPSTDSSVVAAVKQKQIRRGVKEVQKFINKGEKGIMVLAGDTLPIEVYCHLPVMCEDRNLPYVYIPSKTDLGAAAGSKRPTCVIMVKPHEEYQEAYDECLEEVQALPPPM
uniref:H/ACA ribonucleoprotein complex subunit 2 n=1 Tax=Monodon monoceros TaxID=40151 RepID=A0A8C6AN27_MONMO